MDHAATRRRPAPNRASLYQDITDRIIAELEAGRVPWVQPWSAAAAPLAMPRNATTGRKYSGINILILWHTVIEHGFSTQHWLTFRQALGLGGSVRKGEHGTTVVYASRFTPGEDNARGSRDRDGRGGIPFLKRFTVFNADQCDGLPDTLTAPVPAVPDAVVPPAIDALIKASGADFRLGGDQAFYDTRHDYVQVPRPGAFHVPINFARTAAHELSHWTGARKRLGRDQSGAFGSKPYFIEECVAELSAAFVCASLGIVPTVRHADYLGAWLDIVREDNRAIVRAASAASKAADYLLAFLPEAASLADQDMDGAEQEAA
ncbi:MAG: antirestriction protein ArdC [Rhizobiales bacterium 24-66-13]|uniref:ArdC family protein n=1 Tax=Xanthobacteraceae TaxID=335928 RepID=UPI000BD166A3|nr:MAG: antirestriction protein ArdC [Rhizobiales bacterium 12-66-7]OYY89083.1 MAG: antirestriction protein ArdC [Rhizobiales bacterium 35-66-30]OYZ82327.1 MAG: antirestriction protein ArdC [Rhizobiales bacterium 24-66-13]OZB11461.1 MAG: antirestriction protein ArdC [Rhizobiales bacterium 39-66-18]